jgi:heme exporter protein A
MNVCVENVSRVFNRRTIFKDVSFKVQQGEIFGLTGKNGSGKSTLLKIIAGLLSPSKGKVEYSGENGIVSPERIFSHVGFVAPYLALYDEFSAIENIKLYCAIRGVRYSPEFAKVLLEKTGLPVDRKDPIRSYSSGMKQRMKMIFAILHRPPMLLLDEPISNLDSDGVGMVYSIIGEWRQFGSVIIATNDASDIAQCDRTIMLATK